MYDLIGDVHGYASVLKNLLKKLGYNYRNGTYQHPDRKVIFVGDYIDRGPEIPETLRVVRSMVEYDQAIALMGNHEFNSILYNEPNGKGGFLRKHSAKNNRQHMDTLRQFQGNDDKYDAYIKWFKTLPIFFENEDLRAIHACWDENRIHELQPYVSNAVLKNENYRKAGERDTDLHKILDDLLKGIEVELPEGEYFKDKDGHKRTETRIKWWLNPVKTKISEWSFSDFNLTDDVIAAWRYNIDSYYFETEKPVFFGHYWLRGIPRLQRPNVCCLDYSIGKKDKLVAYRYDGENEVQDEKFEWIEYQE